VKTVGPALAALLASGNAIGADVYTIVLAYGGGTLRYTSFDQDIKNGANTFSSTGPVFTRGAIQQRTGFQVSTLDLSIAPKATDLVLGLSWAQAARIGALDGATCLVERAFMDASAVGQGKAAVDVTAAGLLHMFYGQIVAPKFGRGALQCRIDDARKLLDVKVPIVLDQPGCSHVLFDARCTLNRATYAVASSVLSGSTAWAINCGVSNPAGWFDLGDIAFTSGPNAGLTRTVRKYTPGSPATLLLLSPLPAAPAPGDTFNAYPGCDLAKATCENKFSNGPNFDGEPFIPPPETAV
jgi:hypothetical protein